MHLPSLLLVCLSLLHFAECDEFQNEERKPKVHNFPAYLSKHEKVVYSNGIPDYTMGFDFIISPGAAQTTAIYDDFPVSKHNLTFDGFQIIMAEAENAKVCAHLSPNFQIFSSAANGYPIEIHGPFTLKTVLYKTKTEQGLGTLYHLVLHFKEVKVKPGHYWFKFSCFCSEYGSTAFALGTSLVQHDEAWISTQDYTGPISSSPLILPPHDFAFALTETYHPPPPPPPADIYK